MYLLELVFGGRPTLRDRAPTTSSLGNEEQHASQPLSAPKPSSRLPAYLQLNPPVASARLSGPAVPRSTQAQAPTPISAAPSAPASTPAALADDSRTPGAPDSSNSSTSPASEAVGTPKGGDTGLAAVRLADCTSRACSGVLKAFKRALHDEGQQLASGTGGGGGGGAAAPIAPTAQTSTAVPGMSEAASSTDAAASAPICPPDTAELGRATWTFLHSVATAYPERPSGRQQELMRCMMEGVAEFYPCEVCREHLREQVAASPPRVATALDLNLWLCGIHNEVNEMLGKPLFDCSRIGERWRDGPPDGSCN